MLSTVCLASIYVQDMNLFQTIAIGYKQHHPSSVVVVQAYDPRPSLRIKATENSAFRRFGFVDAVKELNPVGSLGLLEPDFKVYFTVLF